MPPTIEVIRPWADTGDRITPADAKIDMGWRPGEQPAMEWENERQHLRDTILKELAEYVNAGIPLNDLINGSTLIEHPVNDEVLHIECATGVTTEVGVSDATDTDFTKIQKPGIYHHSILGTQDILMQWVVRLTAVGGTPMAWNWDSTSHIFFFGSNFDTGIPVDATIQSISLHWDYLGFQYWAPMRGKCAVAGTNLQLIANSTRGESDEDPELGTGHKIKIEYTRYNP